MFINLTPHKLNVRTANGEMLDIEPSGMVARIAVSTVIVRTTAEGVELKKPEYGTLTGLEGLSFDEGDVLVVSALAVAAVQAAYPQATVASPGALLRNAEGQPIGCDGLNLA